MQECNRCKTAGYPNQLIGFEKTGQDAVAGKFTWRLVDEKMERRRSTIRGRK
jgi:hypothetical protein